MTDFKNPAVKAAKPISQEAGGVVVVREIHDLANTAYRPAALAVNDRIQIGVVPAGQKLVPHLCALQIPDLDTNGTPTAAGSIGSNGSPAALKAAAALGTSATTVVGAGFDLANGDLGAQDVDVPVYLVCTTAAATLATTGKIVFDVATRPYDGRVDTDKL